MNMFTEYTTNRFLLYIVLILLGFFGIRYLPNQYPYFAFILLLALGDFFKYWNQETPYTKPILLYILFLCVSFVYSYLFNNQRLVYSVVYSYLYFGPLLYFVLIKYRPTAKQIEHILVSLCVIYCISYILQWLIYPTVIFKSALDEININENQFRMRLNGSLCCYILFFYGSNRLYIHRKPFYLFYTVLGFVPIIMMGFRSLVSLSLVSSFLMIPFVVKSTKKTIIFIILSSIFIGFGLQSEIVQGKLTEMQERNENEQNFSNSDYIRYISLDYYWDYCNKPAEKIFGGGVPIDPRAKYVKDIKSAAEFYHFYWMDLGLVGLSFVIGLPAVLLLVFLYCKCIIQSQDRELQFVRFTLFVVLIGSIFTSMEVYRQGNLVILPLLLYYVYIFNEEKQTDNLILNDDYNC